MQAIKYDINASNIVAIQIFAKYVGQAYMHVHFHFIQTPWHTYIDDILIYNKIITRSGYLNINIGCIHNHIQTQNQSISAYI